MCRFASVPLAAAVASAAEVRSHADRVPWLLKNLQSLSNLQDLKQPPEGFTKSLKSSRISKGSQTRVELRRRKVASLEVSQRSLVTGGCVASPLGCNRGICGRGPLARRPRHLAPLEFAKSLESSRISNDLHKASPNHSSLQGFQRVPTPESSCVKEMSLRLRSRSGAW